MRFRFLAAHSRQASSLKGKIDATSTTATPEPKAPAARRTGRQYRAIFISDIHLGTRGCKAEYLLDFLRHNESDVLYLVGDVIDGWAMRNGFYWPQAHNDVVQKILRKARKGTRVVYVLGNHDEFGRQFIGLEFGGISLADEVEHRLADGRRLWVVHGDLADGVIHHAKWLAYVGDQLYDFALWLNRHFNAVRARLGLGYWSLSAYLKHKVKNAVSFISSFEQVLAREARRRGYDGVLCGHIHHAEIRAVDGLLYCNSGDWVESLTAVVETLEGELCIVRWNEVLSPGEPVPHWAEAEPAPRVEQPAAALAGGKQNSLTEVTA